MYVGGMEYYEADQIDKILEEISSFEVQLAPDPTLPHLRGSYLQKSLSECRRYLNRVVYYMQQFSTQIRELKREVRERELDLELKMADKLADDELVRRQPSVDDRKALAMAQLRDEHRGLANLRVRLLDLEESHKIVKFKHSDLVRTNADIKTQRQIIKDDRDMGGYDGVPAGGAVSDGMRAAVTPIRVDPKDLLDPDKRPNDMPEPLDEAHAEQIAAYFSGSGSLPTDPPKRTTEETDPPKLDESEPAEPATSTGVVSSYDSLLK